MNIETHHIIFFFIGFFVTLFRADIWDFILDIIYLIRGK